MEETAKPESCDSDAVVLECVVAHCKHLQLLHSCCLVSTSCSDNALQALHADAPSIIDHLDAQLLDRINSAFSALGPLRWLLRVLGQQRVNSPDVARALMRLTGRLSASQLNGFGRALHVAGLVLTDDLMVCLAKHSPVGAYNLLWQTNTGGTLSPLYRAVSGFSRHYWANPDAQLEEMLPQVTADNLPDLLLLSCDGGEKGLSLFELLWKLDADTLHVISTSTPAAGGDVSSAAAQVQQQQRKERACAAVFQLLHGCVRAGNYWAATRVLACPAAADLGVEAVQGLLATAAVTPCNITVILGLLKLPGADNLEVAFVGSVLRSSLAQRQPALDHSSDLPELLQLSAAAGLTKDDLLGALKAVPNKTEASRSNIAMVVHALDLEGPCKQEEDLPAASIVATLRRNILQAPSFADSTKQLLLQLLLLPSAKDIPASDLLDLLKHAVKRADADYCCRSCGRNEHAAKLQPTSRRACGECQLVWLLADRIRSGSDKLAEFEVEQLIVDCLDNPDSYRRHFGCCFQRLPAKWPAIEARESFLWGQARQEATSICYTPMFDLRQHIKSSRVLKRLLQYYGAGHLQARAHLDALLQGVECSVIQDIDEDLLTWALLATARSLDHIDSSNTGGDGSTDAISPLLRCTPAVWGVERKTWLEVLRCILHHPTMRGIPAGLLELEAVQELTAGQVSELVRLAEAKGDAAAVAALSGLGQGG